MVPNTRLKLLTEGWDQRQAREIKGRRIKVKERRREGSNPIRIVPNIIMRAGRSGDSRLIIVFIPG